MKVNNKNRKHRFKKFLASSLIGASLISSLCSCTIEDETTSKTDYRSKDFYIAHVGDHYSILINDKEEKIKDRNKKNIPVGVIINSNAENECDIYNDVEYAKGIVKDYDIKYPVYLDINDIVANDDLNDETKALLIRDFLEKCEDNKMYVGIYGTDSNLCYLMDNLGFTGKDYDAFLVMDRSNVKYTGTYNNYVDTSSSVCSKTDLSEIIEKKDLNNSDNFVNDIKYVIEKGDTSSKLEEMFGMSTIDIVEFNDLDFNEFNVGTELRIPKLRDLNTKKESTNTNLYVGCDVSHYQTENNAKWELLSKNFDFMILKSNQGLTEDPLFSYYANGCMENNIPFGIYCFNKYWSNKYNIEDFAKKQTEQAVFTISLLKDKKVDYPVYLDVESQKGLSNSNLPNEYVNVMLDIWYNKMTEAGYIPGIYGGQVGLNYLQSNTNYSLDEKFELWVAGGKTYNKPVKLEEINPSFDNLSYYDESLKDVTNMIQPTEACTNGGASNHAGYLDIDFSRVNFADTYNFTEGDYQIKRFEKNNKKDRIPIVIISLAGLGFFGACVRLDDYFEKKNKEKEKSLTIRRGDFK